MNRSSTDNWPAVREASRKALPPAVLDFIEECREREHPKSALIAVLHRVQDECGHLGRDQLNAVAQLLQVPTARVYGAATFYHFFRLRPRGRFLISVCLGTACYVKGADQVNRRLMEELGVGLGETTADGLFSLETTRCLGTCGLAPVIMINDNVHGPLKPDDIPGLLERYIQRARKEEAGGKT